MAKILIIEQDAFFADVLSQKIQKGGHQTLAVSNGAVAVEQMKMYRPDVVLLNIGITTADGYKILEKKKGEPALAKIPLIMISAAGDLSEIKKAVDLGVTQYVVKAQLNLDELMTKINSSLPQDNHGAGGQGILAGKKVMWVEDDQFLSDLIARKLSTQGCELIFAGSGEDALKLLEDKTPDVILLDILLPGINGLDVLEHIKTMPRLKDVPVIILSNFSQQTQVDRGKELGAKRFLVKATIVLDDLIKEIATVLEEAKK